MQAVERDQASEIVSDVLRWSDADETEVVLAGGDVATTSFAGLQATAATHQAEARVRIRYVRLRGTTARVARVTAPVGDEAILRAALRRARALTEVAEPVQDWYGLVVPEVYATIAQTPRGYFDSATAVSGPALRADAAADALLPARRRGGMSLFGHVRVRTGESASRGVVCVANSLGVFRYHLATTVDARVRVQLERGGAAEATAWGHQPGEVDVEALFAAAAERAGLASTAANLDAGAPVVLEPDAVAALVAAFLPSFSARAVRLGVSLLHGRPGQLVAAPSISLVADPAEPGLLARPFDVEGVPSRRLTLIEAGRTLDQCIERDPTAISRDASGYATYDTLGGIDVPGPVTLRAGSGSLAELHARHPDASSVSAFGGLQVIDGRETTLAGVTRDGVLVRRGGAYVGASPDAGFVLRLYDLFRDVIDASDPVRVGDMMVPALVLSRFPFAMTEPT